MVDVVANMSLTRAFGRIAHECSRLDATIAASCTARGRSLRHLEKLRIAHALTVVAMTVALLLWALSLWRAGAATAGDVVLISTLGLSLLSATRDLAVALVDVTQHWARLGEALTTLLSPHELTDHADAAPLPGQGRAYFHRACFVPLSRRQADFQRSQLRNSAGAEGRRCRRIRRRQVDAWRRCCNASIRRTAAASD